MKFNRRALSVIAAVLFTTTGVSSVYAQQGDQAVATPTSAQLELNDAGVQAIIAEDYALAVQLFDSSLALGPINITYVNRGRALQHAGKCEEADASYEAAFLAPAMSEPSAENVAATIARYRAELRETCPGKIELVCDPVTLHVTIDGKDLGECPQTAIELSKGEHQIRGTLMGKSVETIVDVAPLKTRRLSLTLDTSDSAPELQAGVVLDAPEGIRPLSEEKRVSSGSGSNMAGYLFLGGGAALLAGGAVMDTVPETARNGAYDGMDVVPVGMYVGAAVLVVYGVVKLMN